MVSDFELDAEKIRLLDWLHDGTTNSFDKDINTFIREQNLPKQWGRVLADQCEHEGLVKVDPALGGNLRARLTPLGVDRVHRTRAARADSAQRRRDLQEKMLRWLFDQEEQDLAPGDWSEFLAEKPSFLGGTPFSMKDVARQAPYLVERGLLEGARIDQAADGCINPRLTAAGRDCVTDFSGNVSVYMSSIGGGSTVNNTGPVFHGNVHGSQMAWGNQSVTQTQSNADQVAPEFQAIHQILTDVLDRLPGLALAEEDREDVKSETDIVLAEIVSSEPDDGKIKRAIRGLKRILAPLAVSAGAGAAAGTQDGTQEIVSHWLAKLGEFAG